MANIGEVKLATSGMHCQSCSMLIEMNVADLDGVESVKSDYQTGVTTVVFDLDKIGVDDIIGEIVRSGYGAEVAR